MDNVYKSYFPVACFNCVCYYCQHTYCPNGRRSFNSDLDFCWESRERGSCPRLDCDYFVNRRVYGHKYIIYKHNNHQSDALKALNSISTRIDELQKAVDSLNRYIKHNSE